MLTEALMPVVNGFKKLWQIPNSKPHTSCSDQMVTGNVHHALLAILVTQQLELLQMEDIIPTSTRSETGVKDPTHGANGTRELQ